MTQVHAHGVFSGQTVSGGRQGVFVVVVPAQAAVRPSITARLVARMYAVKFDRQVEAGAVAAPGSPLAVHVARLASLQERSNLVNSLARFVHTQPSGAGVQLFPVHGGRVEDCRELIEDIILRLRSVGPVGVKGMARLRLLVCDGTGPLYPGGQGNLIAELKGVIAALG